MSNKYGTVTALLFIAFCVASIPFIDIEIQKKQIAEYNAGHEDRLKTYNDALERRRTEPSPPIPHKNNALQNKKKGRYADLDLDFLTLAEPSLDHISQTKIDNAPKISAILGISTLVLSTMAYLTISNRKKIYDGLTTRLRGWMGASNAYIFSTSQRVLLLLLTAFAAWKSYHASRFSDENITTLLGAAISIGALVLAYMKRKPPPHE